ncbi:MAG: thioredoxin family protein [Lachnospiraceae bacterium]
MKKEKAILSFLAFGSVVVLIILFFSLGISQRKQNKEIFSSITADEVVTAIKEKKDMIIYCGQETCSACRTFSPILESIAIEEKKDIYYLDVDLISSQKELEKYHIQETPTLINISDGKVLIYRGTMQKENIRKAVVQTDIEKEVLNGIVEINDDKLEELNNYPKDFILYIGREDCGDCQNFNPILEQYLLDKSYGVYFLDIKKYRENAIKENASKEEKEFYEQLKEKYEIEWVPTLIHIRNGIQISRFEFLDSEYGSLSGNKQKERESEYIAQFYKWMNKEMETY